jgi:Tfp pilus assembly protein PilP
MSWGEHARVGFVLASLLLSACSKGNAEELSQESATIATRPAHAKATAPMPLPVPAEPTPAETWHPFMKTDKMDDSEAMGVNLLQTKR